MAPKFLSTLLAALFVFPSLGTPAYADAEESLKDVVAHIWVDQTRMLTSPLRVNKLDLIVWGSAIGSILYLAPRYGKERSVDERIEQGIDRRNTRANDFLKSFTHVGDAPVLFGVTVVGYGIGRWKDLPRVRTTSLHVFEALMDAGIASQVITILAGRRRPVDHPSRGPFLGPIEYFSDSNNGSFVSGHAALSFAMATVVTRESRSYYLGVPAYLLASGVAYSRIHVERHWLSDVIGGSVLGYSVGILVTNRPHKKPLLAGTIYPTVSEDSMGLAWKRTF